jgi:hypothetical protein
VSKQRKSRGRPSQNREDINSSNISTSEVRPSGGRKRKGRDPEIEEPDELEAETATASPRYIRLEAKKRRIPQEVIERWPVISPPVLEQISDVLRRAKDAVALSRRDPRRQDEADEVLNGVVRHLERHFASTKIPPQARAQQFNLDFLSAHNNRIRQELTTVRHRNQLLEESIQVDTESLKLEESWLETTKANAQQWRRQWKSQEKKHVGSR